jgi:hypothetical protein
MRNAHARMGSLEFVKRTKDTTTKIRVHLERFIGEAVDGGRTRGHLLSVFGGDSEIGAIWAAVAEGAVFTVEGPDFARLTVSLGTEAHCFRGTISIPGRKHPIRHLIAISEELALTRPGADREGKRTILCEADPGFVLYRVARRFGLPVVPEWLECFAEGMRRAGVLKPLIGLGCSPVVVLGSKKLFLKWIAQGLRKGDLRIPEANGPVVWKTPCKFLRQ